MTTVQATDFKKVQIFMGQRFTNTTGKTISYTDRYLNLFDIFQEHNDVLEPGQTFEKFNPGSTLFFI